ncbi:NAD(P)-dependent oxidoreductase [Escherichia albertii]|uniref:NAD-dependent epimerase/dehydratase family protein n=1 Tax=Escherichia albertii TaxID=208962 RepID=UPI0021D40488|nr:NAD(P)-dependent oxidoreductase [Escherichia albertii]MCU7344229.1 NAD(P)-dependent oxidoreductase [Escherichia albertii]
MKILVTGATSGLGRNAVQFLLESGVSVVATGRNREVGESLASAGAKFVALDLTQAFEEDCARLMEGCDAVWHCAAKSSPWGDKTTFWQANVRATNMLAQTAGMLRIPRFIHISTPAVYFDFQHHYDLQETYLARAFSSYYASSKYAAEQAIAGAVSQYPTTTFILLRPRGLFGPYDNVIVPRLMRQLQQGGGLLRLPRGGEALLDLTFVQNVVYAMQLATQVEGLRSGSIYNISNHQPQPLSVMLDALLRQQLGLSYHIAAVPWPLLSLVARSLELYGKCVNQEPVITRYSAGTLCFDMTLSAQKAIAELGYRPRFSVEQGIAITGQWLREHGKNNRI